MFMKATIPGTHGSRSGIPLRLSRGICDMLSRVATRFGLTRTGMWGRSRAGDESKDFRKRRETQTI